MKFIKKIHAQIFNAVSEWLIKDTQAQTQTTLSDFEKMTLEIKLGDVLLVDGRSRVSQVIKMVTQSRWSHAAIYIGRYNEIADTALRALIKKYYLGSDNEQLLVESMMSQGVIITPLCFYRTEDIRLCRPVGLKHKDAQKLLQFCLQRLGTKYDMRQILDLARFLFPWGIVPRQWRTSLFEHNAGAPTHASCSRLLADAFDVVRYPILPDVIYADTADIEIVQRNARLFTPSDFDNSPFFSVLKFPIFDTSEVAFYQNLHWRDDLLSNDGNGLVKLTSLDTMGEEEE